MSNTQEKSRPGQGGSSSNVLCADPTLVKLLQASLALPDGIFSPIPGTTKMIVRADQWMLALAINERCQELGGGIEHVERALDSMIQRRRDASH